MKYSIAAEHIVLNDGKLAPDGTPAPRIIATVYEPDLCADVVAAANETVGLRVALIKARAQTGQSVWTSLAYLAFTCGTHNQLRKRFTYKEIWQYCDKRAKHCAEVIRS